MEIKVEGKGIVIATNVDRHIYVVADKFDIYDIDEGDYVIRDGYQLLKVSPKLLNAIVNGHVANLDCKKIIATTDTELNKDGLPQLSPFFIPKFFHEYDNVNKDVRLFIEYEADYSNVSEKDGSYWRASIMWNPKVYANNHVLCLIQPKKDKFNRNELLDMLEKYDREFKIDSFAYTKPVNYTVKDWLEKQL